MQSAGAANRSVEYTSTINGHTRRQYEAVYIRTMTLCKDRRENRKYHTCKYLAVDSTAGVLDSV
jgi:hypothetical protein